MEKFRDKGFSDPKDLNGRDGSTIRKELFGDDPEDNPWWALEREDDRSFRWNDKYLGINWRATHGYLIGLHEVSTIQQAAKVASRNRMHLFFEDGGLYFKGHGVAELFIRCAGMPSREEIRREEDLYRLRFRSGTTAKIGFGSFLFIRLIAGPAAEVNPESFRIQGVSRRSSFATCLTRRSLEFRRSLRIVPFQDPL